MRRTLLFFAIICCGAFGCTEDDSGMDTTPRDGFSEGGDAPGDQVADTVPEIADSDGVDGKPDTAEAVWPDIEALDPDGDGCLNFPDGIFEGLCGVLLEEGVNRLTYGAEAGCVRLDIGEQLTWLDSTGQRAGGVGSPFAASVQCSDGNADLESQGWVHERRGADGFEWVVVKSGTIDWLGD